MTTTTNADLILFAKEHGTDEDAMPIARFASEAEARSTRAMFAAMNSDVSFFLAWDAA